MYLDSIREVTTFTASSRSVREDDGSIVSRTMRSNHCVGFVIRRKNWK